MTVTFTSDLVIGPCARSSELLWSFWPHRLSLWTWHWSSMRNSQFSEFQPHRRVLWTQPSSLWTWHWFGKLHPERNTSITSTRDRIPATVEDLQDKIMMTDRTKLSEQDRLNSPDSPDKYMLQHILRTFRPFLYPRFSSRHAIVASRWRPLALPYDTHRLSGTEIQPLNISIID